jgi:hypothetical protein
MNPSTINKNFEIGDKVHYTHGFLKSINCYSGDIPHLTGIVQSVKTISRIKKTIVKVLWSDGSLQSSLSCNLVKNGSCDITE